MLEFYATNMNIDSQFLKKKEKKSKIIMYQNFDELNPIFMQTTGLN